MIARRARGDACGQALSLLAESRGGRNFTPARSQR
jgi:hypothetical protein